MATIDIGTNTILLLVAEVASDGSFRVLDGHAAIARLGQGVDQSRRIGVEGQARSLKILQDYRRRCQELGVNEFVAVGTSVLRDAVNADEFKTRLKAELDIELRVLSGEEEAGYSFLAVQRGLGLQHGEVLVVDVGGGSTELIWGKEAELVCAVSLDLGSVRLTERFLRSDPARDEEIGPLVAAIDRELNPVLGAWGVKTPDTMVGIAGTFTTLAAIEKGLRRYSHSEVHGCRLSRAEVGRQIALFKSKTIAERKKIPGLEPERADVILAGALIIDRVVTLVQVDHVVVSDQGIRYGLLYERLDALQR